MQTSEAKPIPLLPLVVLLAGLIIAFHLGCAWLGRPIYRFSYLGSALVYAREHIDPLRPVIVGWNATGTPTIQELPIWQVAAGLALMLTHPTWEGWANVASLLLFLPCLWPFFLLARKYVGDRAAWWALAFFLAQPLIIVFSGEASPSGLSLALMIWFLFFAEKLVQNGNGWWWVPAAFFGALMALTKVPFFMVAGLCAAFVLIIRRSAARAEVMAAGSNEGKIASGRSSGWTWLLLGAVGGVTAVIFYLWTRYTDSVAAQAEYPYVELRVSHSHFITFWYFGDLHYRLTPGHWLKGTWRFLHATLGTMALLPLPVIALIKPGNLLAKCWLLATLIVTLVFTHLVLEHWHYYLMCAPAVAMLCGATMARWEGFAAAEAAHRCLRFGLVAAVLICCAIDGVITMRIAMSFDYFPKQVGTVIAQHTSPADKLIAYTCDPNWGGEVLYRSGRDGLSVMALKGSVDSPSPKGLIDLLTNPEDLARLKALGYNKLVLVSESPVWYAAQAANPGSKRQRVFYPETISSAVDAWPVAFRSPDVLIKDIP